MKVVFNNIEYRKNNRSGFGLKDLCFAIFKYFLEQKPHLTYEEIKNIFNQWHCNNNFVVLSKSEWEQKTDNLKERYFKPPIHYADKELYFTTQWGNNGGDCDNVNKMINFAKEQGYNIKIVKEDNAMDTIEKENEYNDIKNIILYGAPGVGKTHNTNRLIGFIEEGKSDVEIFKILKKNEFVENNDKPETKNRVKFVTFHQSFGYEDFIEGFRPNEDGKIELVDGIFKNICKQAIEDTIKSNINIKLQEKINIINEKPTIWKISLGWNGEIKRECFNDNCIRIGWDHYNNLNEFTENITQRELKDFYNLQVGDIVLAFKNQWEIDGIGVVIGDYEFNDNYKNYKHKRDVDWITKDKVINIKEYNKNVRLTLSTLYRLPRISKEDILKMIEENTSIEKNTNVKSQNYYLIIDEINRGNISKIFGELITLTEEDKRDSLEVVLPYSKESLKVPSNLYIIGTMNSTDKSIALIDIALRRRFTFIKMEPNAELIKHQKAKEIFEKLNKYITDTIGEDFKIGHSYFMKIQSNEELDFILEYKIIPLLEEYYYGNSSGLKGALDVIKT